MSPGADEHIRVYPGLQPPRQPPPPGPLAGGLPIDDYHPPASVHGDEVVPGGQAIETITAISIIAAIGTFAAMTAHRGGQDDLGVTGRGQVGWWLCQVAAPPALEVLVDHHARQPLGRNAEYVLVDHAVECRPLLEIPLVLQRRLCLKRRPGQAAQVAQLKPSRAVHVILEAALAELEAGG